MTKYQQNEKRLEHLLMEMHRYLEQKLAEENGACEYFEMACQLSETLLEIETTLDQHRNGLDIAFSNQDNEHSFFP